MAKQTSMEDTLVKKLKTVSNTQDSIPMLSLWIIHHKTSHKKIVETWLDMVKKAKNSHRLTLLYLCNDVVQNCNRKNAPEYRESFADVLAEAVTHLRDTSIKSNVQRVVKIWAKRGIYDSEFTDQLLAALITNRAPEKLRNKLLVEYKTSSLIDEIKTFKILEDEISLDQNRLKAIRMDVSSSDAIRKLKDKIGGEKFSKDFEESATQLESFLERYEKYIEERKSLLDILDQGTVYYHAQYHEAKIVVNAYQSFEGRVNKMKRGLDKVKLRFPSAPSSKVEPSTSHTDDMDMSDDDKELGKKPSKIVAMETKQRRPSTKVAEVKAASTEPPNSTESVIKLLASGFDSLKHPNESAAESIKRVVSGLVSRPGMRGASSNISTEKSTASNETSKESLRIIRPVDDFEEEEIRSASMGSDQSGELSPPSPTGSPELNIASPPRHQSLDSRLAEILDSRLTESKPPPVESDNESDTDLIKVVNDSVNASKSGADNLLPGLGDLDIVSETEEKIQPINFYNNSKPPVEPYVVRTEPQEIVQPEVVQPVVLAPSTNQSIPVIGGLARAAVPIADGSSTPTLDEDPYNSTPYIPPPATTLLSPPRFSGDALGFLTNFLGSVKKAEVPAPASTVVQPSTAISAIYDSWPPVQTNVATTSTSAWSQTWNQASANAAPPIWPMKQSPSPSPSPAAQTVTTPTFGYPAKSEPNLLQSWSSNLPSSNVTSPPATNYAPPPPIWSPAPATVVSTVNHQYRPKSPPVASSSSSLAFPPPERALSFPPPDFKRPPSPLRPREQNVLDPPNSKRPKWETDDHDRGYRSGLQNPPRSDVNEFSSLSTSGIPNRRNSNLITLSAQEQSSRPSPEFINNDPLAGFKSGVRSSSLDNPPVPLPQDFDSNNPMALFKSSLRSNPHNNTAAPVPNNNEPVNMFKNSLQSCSSEVAPLQQIDGIRHEAQKSGEKDYSLASTASQPNFSQTANAPGISRSDIRILRPGLQGPPIPNTEPFRTTENSQSFHAPPPMLPPRESFPPPASPGGRFPPSQPPISPKDRFPRPFPAHAEVFPRSERFHRPPTPRMGAPLRRRSSEEHLINLELALLKDEEMREAELRREVMKDMRFPQPPRTWHAERYRAPPPRSPHFRPRMSNPPRFRGRPRPRMRF